MTIEFDKSLDIALGNYTVYKHTSPSGKVYIGITRDKLQHRWKGGHGYVNNTHFFRAIQKYGWAAFKHEELFTGLTEEEAQKKEIELIAQYDSTNPAKGYNRDPGGWVRSEETAAKISKSLTGKKLSPEHCKHMSEALKGRQDSAATRKKRSESAKKSLKVKENITRLLASQVGQPKTPEHRRNIALAQPSRRAVINLDTGERFTSVQDAAASCNGAGCNISKVCKGERQRAYGFRWKYEEVSSLAAAI